MIRLREEISLQKRLMGRLVKSQMKWVGLVSLENEQMFIGRERV